VKNNPVVNPLYLLASFLTSDSAISRKLQLLRVDMFPETPVFKKQPKTD
jgi:hypothetical protein